MHNRILPRELLTMSLQQVALESKLSQSSGRFGTFVRKEYAAATTVVRFTPHSALLRRGKEGSSQGRVGDKRVVGKKGGYGTNVLPW